VHAAHLRKVDHHSAVADREPGNAVPAPAHGDQDLVLAREFHCPHYVRDARAADNHRRPAVDHPVVNLARRVVRVVAGT